MAIVGEPCNVDAHANIPDLFMTTECFRFIVKMFELITQARKQPISYAR